MGTRGAALPPASGFVKDDETVTSIGSGLLSLIATHGSVILFLVVLVEEIGIPLPIPSDLMLLFSGSLVANGKLNPILTITVVVVAIVLGTTTLFTVARRGGRPLLLRYGHFIHCDERRLDRVEQRLHVHAFWRLTALRLVPGLRPYSTMTAGLLGLPRRLAVLAFAVAGMIWASVWISLGAVLGPHFGTVVPMLQRAERAAGLGLIIALVLLVLVLWSRSRILPRLTATRRHDRSQ